MPTAHLVNKKVEPSFRSGGRRSFLVSRGQIFGLAALTVVISMAGCRSTRNEAVDLSVASARELSFRGIDAMEQGDWTKAENLLGKAVETCDTDVRAHRNYAETLWQRGESDLAIKHMEEASRLSDGEPELLVRLGEMHLAAGHLSKASKQADAAIRRNRRLASAWALQGDVQLQRGERDEALANYHRALCYQEHFPRVQLTVARIYQHTQRPQRMLATLESLQDQYATGQVPQDVYLMQGIALNTLGRPDQAIDTLIAAKNVDKPTADLMYHLAEAYLLAGDRGSARHSMNTALSLNASHAPSRQLMARLENTAGNVSVVLDRQSNSGASIP
jgi:tetratricopeptide (TPR) repeat protein